VSFGITQTREEVTSLAGSLPFQTRVNARQDTTAGHAAIQYRLWERLDLSAGLRHDAVGSYTGATTWRVGAVYALPEAGMRLRASGGTGFNAPSLFQRFGVIGTTFRGNPNLRRSTASAMISAPSWTCPPSGARTSPRWAPPSSSRASRT
jgi:vitamin B12 transporter